jgi:hypothetical protein
MVALKLKTMKVLLPVLMLVGIGTGTWALQPGPGDAPASSAQPQVASPQGKKSQQALPLRVEKEPTPGDGRSDTTKKRLAQVEKNLDSIVLEISPTRAPTERDALRLLGPKAKGPEGRPGMEHRDTRKELAKLVDALADEGFFDRAVDDPVPIPRKATYVIQLYGPVVFAEPLQGEPLLDRLLAMRKAMTGEAALAMDRLYVEVQWQDKDASRPIRAGEDILHYADRFGMEQLVQKPPDRTERRPRYGDDALAKAEEELRHIPRPWTLTRIMKTYHDELKKPRLEQTNKPHLERLLAASRDPRAAVLLGEQVEGNQPAPGAVRGLMDYFLPSVAREGGTEAQIVAVQNWWKEQEAKWRRQAKQLEEGPIP